MLRTCMPLIGRGRGVARVSMTSLLLSPEPRKFPAQAVNMEESDLCCRRQPICKTKQLTDSIAIVQRVKCAACQTAGCHARDLKLPGLPASIGVIGVGTIGLRLNADTEIHFIRTFFKCLRYIFLPRFRADPRIAFSGARCTGQISQGGLITSGSREGSSAGRSISSSGHCKVKPRGETLIKKILKDTKNISKH